VDDLNKLQPGQVYTIERAYGGAQLTSNNKDVLSSGYKRNFMPLFLLIGAAY
jgi:hypothetical protein